MSHATSGVNTLVQFQLGISRVSSHTYSAGMEGILALHVKVSLLVPGFVLFGLQLLFVLNINPGVILPASSVY